MTEQITTWQRFAEITIKTNDLDPMYSVIRGLNQTKSRSWMGRFIMYFLCFYDAGGAARAADEWTDVNFWEKLKEAGQRKETKRGTERRHWRGKNALAQTNNLMNRPFNNPWLTLQFMYGYEWVVRPATGESPVLPPERPPTYTEFYKRMTTQFAGTGFGPYFIWKLYDIFNICLDMPITLSLEEAVKYMPDEPRKAAEHFFPSIVFRYAVSTIAQYISQFDHPVLPGAKCGLAEAETVLCMMKGFFQTKSHEIGDDIVDKYKQLADNPELTKLLPPFPTITYTR